MTMVDEDAVHRAQRRRAQRRKKLAVGVAGLAAILAGGGYAVSVYQAARDSTIIGGDTGALGPPAAVSPPAAGSPSAAVSPSAVTPVPSASSSPSSRPPSTRLSAARQLSRPSPTPTPSPLADEQAAGAQVSRLLPAPANASGGPAAAGRSAVVANETGADESAIRIVSGRHDLRTKLWAADAGVQVGDARCTQNLRIDGRAAQVRPRMLLCWRVSVAKSVVTVATNATGKPSTATSVRVIERVWQQLG
jgi:hypothetical protein